MPNARDADINEIGRPKFLLVGSTGSGKTAQIATLPGRTFAYLFDPSALATLRGFDIQYEAFYPSKVNIAAQSLTKGKQDTPKSKEDASEVYRLWETDFEAKTKAGFWDSIDNICFDSFTTFSDVVMDRILFLNGRPGHFPQQDDWTAQMQAITNVVRTLVGMNKLLLFTAHDEFKQDETTTRMQNVLVLTGKLRVKIPLLFSEIWHMECQSKPDAHKYVAQTRPDRMNPTIRCTIRDLEMFEDVTITDWKKPSGSGIGRILRDKRGYAPGNVERATIVSGISNPELAQASAKVASQSQSSSVAGA